MMGEIEYGYGTCNEFLPKYGGVDWNAVFVSNNKGEDQRPVWAECHDEDGELCQQLNQTNCAIYINHTNPSLDCIATEDPRDDTYIWLYRYQDPEIFQTVVDKIRSEVMYVETKYPMKEIAKYFLKLASLDVQEGIPDFWT